MNKQAMAIEETRKILEQAGHEINKNKIHSVANSVEKFQTQNTFTMKRGGYNLIK